ncbi:MAG: transcription antitermination factor NusB [Clostridiales Family XIII bacterium]|nr:transcription antitermination factor NusB [Clostridiales Family XIII bacterium]
MKSKPAYRKKTRELLMRIVFQMMSTGDFSDAARDAFLADTSLYIGNVREDAPPGCIFDEAADEAPDLPYLNWAFACLRDHLGEIDCVISQASEKWSVKRMGIVDLAILRLAASELLYMEDIDDSISVNEAVLMAHKYGSEKSPAFVNGILGAIARANNGAGA